MISNQQTVWETSRDVRIVPHHNKLFNSGDDPFDRSMLTFALGLGEGVREMHLARMAVGLLIVGAIEFGATASARAQAAAPWKLPSNAEIEALLVARLDQQRQGVGIVAGVIDASGRRISSGTGPMRDQAVSA